MDVFHIWLSGIGVEIRCLMKALKIDEKDKFILIKLKIYCQQRGITIKYMTLYLHKEYSLAKK